jgi:hypothetical protein
MCLNCKDYGQELEVHGCSDDEFAPECAECLGICTECLADEESVCNCDNEDDIICVLIII